MKRWIMMSLLCVCASASAALEPGRPGPGRSALIAPAAPWRLDVAADIGLSSRSFVVRPAARPALLRVDTTRILINAGFHLLPWLHAHAGAGWMQSEVDRDPGEGGFSWQAGLHANLIEQVIAASPVTGPRQSMGLTLESLYRYSSSNRGTDTFQWHETIVTPLFHYTVFHAGNPLRHNRWPDASALQLGMQFSTIDGDLGSQTVRENRNFAAVVGTQFLLTNQWSVQTRAIVHGASDRAVEIRIGRYF